MWKKICMIGIVSLMIIPISPLNLGMNTNNKSNLSDLSLKELPISSTMRTPTFEELATDSFLGLSRRNYWFHSVLEDGEGNTYMFVEIFKRQWDPACFSAKSFYADGSESEKWMPFPTWEKSVDTVSQEIYLTAEESTQYLHVTITKDNYHIIMGDSISSWPWSIELLFTPEMTFYYNNGDSAVEFNPTYHVAGFEQVCSCNGTLTIPGGEVELTGIAHAEHFFEDKDVCEAFYQCGKELWMPLNLGNTKGIFVVFCGYKDAGILIDNTYYYIGNNFHISDILIENGSLKYVVVDVFLNNTSYTSRYDAMGRMWDTQYLTHCSASIGDSIFDEGLSWIENIIWAVGDQPIVEIANPGRGCLYIFDQEIISTIFGNTIIIGGTTVEAEAYDEYGIEKVEFYIDDELKFVDDECPYEWLWGEKAFGTHEIQVIACDNEGNNAKDKMEVKIFNIGG